MNSKLLGLLPTLLAMASSHLEDVESGLLDGTYNAEDNPDLNLQREAVKMFKDSVSETRQGSD